MALDHLVFDTTDASTILDSANVGAYLRDAAGNLITSQANGSQRALDVGINVAGVQIDPRQIRALTSADVVTVDQGTSPWITKDQADGSVAPGTAASFSQLAGAVYNSSPITLTNGQQAALQMDANGALKVDLVTPISVATDLNGIYDVSTNPTPDNVGIISFARAATPGLSDQTFTGTGGVANSDAVVAANVHGLDVNAFGMAYNGTTWDRLTSTSGNLNVNIAASAISIAVSDAALANTAIVSHTNTLAVANTAQAAVASPLASRKYLSIYNFANNQMYIGGSGVTAANGFPISPGSYMDLRAGVASAVFFVGSTGKTPEIRTLELS
jgi:hypothetical protein